MQSRRDQVQAHLFVMGRITSGMLRADPDAPESPQGRTNRGTIAGIVVAVLLCTGMFFWGLIYPSKSGSWRDSQSLIVDQDTGTAYLYLGGRLRPVRNYASARLLGGSRLSTHRVRTKSLAGAPHGQPVGIAGAPDSLPPADGLSGDAWAVCSGVGDAGASATVTTVAVGAPGSDDGALTSGEAMLVTGPDADLYLVWQAARLRLDRRAGAMAALGYGGRSPTPVSAAFLDALPAGPDLAAPTVPGMGRPGPVLDGHRTRIGQVFRSGVMGAAPRYFQLRRDGLTEINVTVADLLLGDVAVRRAVYAGRPATARMLPPDVLNSHLAAASSAGGLPDAPPRLVERPQGRSACVRVRPGDAGPQVSVALADTASLGTVAQTAGTAACVPVERVTVPPGGGALVRVLTADGRSVGGTVYLVTDTGTKYRVPSTSDLAALGYSADHAVALPSPLLAMLPTGPDLSAQSASSGGSGTTPRPCTPAGKASKS